MQKTIFKSIQIYVRGTYTCFMTNRCNMLITKPDKRGCNDKDCITVLINIVGKGQISLNC